jgi:hypothetical protein
VGASSPSPATACASASGAAPAGPPRPADFRDNIIYQDGNVYYGDLPYASEAQCADRATQVAAAGQQTQPVADEKWQPLGIFARVNGDETTSNDIFQLGLNKDGVLGGNNYNAVSDNTTPASGALDKKSQRVAWTIGGKKYPVYEAGLFNLTKDGTTRR